MITPTEASPVCGGHQTRRWSITAQERHFPSWRRLPCDIQLVGEGTRVNLSRFLGIRTVLYSTDKGILSPEGKRRDDKGPTYGDHPRSGLASAGVGQDKLR
jgi:hypothetical protein